MTTLLLGSSGQLGNALRTALRCDVLAPSHAALDIVSGDIAAYISRVRPSVVINCVAFHNVDGCEREPLRAFDVNAVSVDRLAAACEKAGSILVTVSTDYVFSGDGRRPYVESDDTEPRTMYGLSKRTGELLAMRRRGSAIVVRTSGLFGTLGSSNKGYTLVDKVLAQAERGETTRMVTDVTFSPSFAPHVAHAMLELIDRRAFGIHHVTNTGACTWFEYVRYAFEKAGLDQAVLEPITYESLGNTTPRPMFSPLANTTFAPLGISALPSWREAVDEYLALRHR